MDKILFINGQSGKIADIFESMRPEGCALETATVAASLDEAAKIKALEGVAFLVLHPATLSAEIMKNAPGLKLIQLLTAGYDKVDIKAAAELGIPVATNGGANSWAVAEHAVMLLLATYKRLIECDASVRAGTWRKPVNGFNTFEVAGKTIGVVGAGNIGKKVATRLKPFETEIIYFDAQPATEIEETLGARRVSLDELVEKADVITLHAPLLDSTRGMFGAAQFEAMKETAVLINTSRAELIDEKALIEALREKKIAAAALDVFPEEPIPEGHPLLELENVIVTPHTAGHSYEGWFRRSKTAWDNIGKITRGEKPGFVVNGV